MSHGVRMLIGCLLPIALVFLWPVLGFDEDGVAFTLFLIAVFVLHIWCAKGHHHNDSDAGGEHADH